MSTPSTDKLSLREKISYGFGDFASDALYWKSISRLSVDHFYTDVFGLTAAAVAAMQGFSRSFDAIFDIIIGMLGDRTEVPLGASSGPTCSSPAFPWPSSAFWCSWVPHFDDKGKRWFGPTSRSTP